jgi:hypothetical protein
MINGLQVDQNSHCTPQVAKGSSSASAIREMVFGFCAIDAPLLNDTWSRESANDYSQ